MKQKSGKQIEILLVEDSPADVLLTREAFQEFKLINTLYVAEDGIEALAFLNQEGKYASSPHPDLILLDWNLPRKNGREVLAEIKANPRFKSIPVVVLTTSHAEQDILQAYNLQANCYIVKPVRFDNFVEAMKTIHEFWFSAVTLPTEVTHEQDPNSGSTDRR
jgi:chemotaxis family two-component system response regulator Rcp1